MIGRYSGIRKVVHITTFVKLLFKMFEIKPELPVTNYIAYKEQTYEVNIDLFNLHSDYFQSQAFNKKDVIHIFEKDARYQSKTIKKLIDFCQSKNILIEKDDVIDLNDLAHYFNVPKLIKITFDYISNDLNLAKKVDLNRRYKNLLGTHEYEVLISENLSFFINDDKLLSLPTPVIYRILQLYI